MSDVIFVKTRHQGEWVTDENGNVVYRGGYQSYSDYFRLAELAGYPICYVDEIDAYDASKTYIITPLNDEWLKGWPDAKAQIIHHEAEWRTDWRADVDEPLGVSRVWHIDPYMGKQKGFEYVPVGSDDRLNEASGNYHSIKQYDVAIMSYQTHRRQVITAQLENMGLRLSALDSLWGNRRSQTLTQSYCMVHTHQNDNAPGIASLRWAIAAAHRLPMITETVRDRGIFGYSCMVQSDYEYLSAFTAHMLKDRVQLQEYGEALHNLLCIENTFRKVIESHV